MLAPGLPQDGKQGYFDIHFWTARSLHNEQVMICHEVRFSRLEQINVFCMKTLAHMKTEARSLGTTKDLFVNPEAR